MPEGFGAPNPRASEMARVRTALEAVLQDNKRLKLENERLRNTLRQVRAALITRKHKAMIDRALRG